MRPSFKRAVAPSVSSVLILALVAVVGGSTRVGAQAGKKAPAAAEKPPALTWGPAPGIFPKGAKMAVESGDPSKSGEFVVRLSFPDGYAIPPHFHPTAEHVRVRSGTFLVGMGDKLDAKATKTMAPGDTATMPAKMHHFAIAKGPTVVRVRAEGPFAMTYVNPADTPKP